MSQQVNSSVLSIQDAAQPLAAVPAAQASLPAAQSSNTQLDRIEVMLAAQRAQQAKLELAIKAAKTGIPNTTNTVRSTQADASPSWMIPALGAHPGWFVATGLAVVLLCVGFVIVWRARFTSTAAPQLAAQNSVSDSLLMVSEYNALQPWGPTSAEAAMSQPAPSNLAVPVQVVDALAQDISAEVISAGDVQHIDLDFDVNLASVAQVDVASPTLGTENDFVSDEVRKVQQSLAHKRAVRKSQQRALQPEVLLELAEPAPEQLLASAFAPLPDMAFDLTPPAAAHAPIVYPAELTDDDAQWSVQLQLAQQMADLGQIEDTQALCQEVFLKGSEAMQSIALQIMTRLLNSKQP